MKRILLIALLLILSGCDLFKRTVKKEEEKTEERIEERIEKGSETSEKVEREVLVFEKEETGERVEIRADDISYNRDSGDFKASGNVLIVSSKSRGKEVEKKDFIAEEKDIKQTDVVEVKKELKQEKRIINKEKTRFSFGFWKWMFLLVLVIICYFVYRRIKRFV